MQLRICVLLGVGLIISVQANFEFTQTAKDCIKEINSNEETIRSLVTEEHAVPEDNLVVQNFFGCIFRGFLNDKNELIVDDKLTNYVVKILTVRMNGKQKLATLVAQDCLEHCKGIKEDTKGKSAVKVMNCLKKRFKEYIDE